MKHHFGLLVTLFLCLVARLAMADRAPIVCEITPQPDAASYPVLSELISQYRPSAMKACKQLDLAAESYELYGQSAETFKGICEFRVVAYYPPKKLDDRQSFGARRNGDCPPQTSGAYVMLYDVSAIEYSEIDRLLEKILESPESWKPYFSRLSFEHVSDTDLKMFEDKIRSGGKLKVAAVYGLESRVGISTYVASFAAPEASDGHFQITLRKLLGVMAVTNIGYWRW